MELPLLQVVYYWMAIVFMTLVFGGLIVIITLVIYLLIRVNKIQKQIQEIVTEFKENPKEKAAEMAFSMGAGIANASAKKIHEAMEKKKHEKEDS